MNKTPFYHQSPAAFATASFGLSSVRADTREGKVLFEQWQNLSQFVRTDKKAALFPRMLEKLSGPMHVLTYRLHLQALTQLKDYSKLLGEKFPAKIYLVRYSAQIHHEK